MQGRRQLAARNQFKKELDFGLVRRGNNRIRPLDVLAGSEDSQGCVLAGEERELRSGLHANGPQILGDISALNDSSTIKLLAAIHGIGALRYFLPARRSRRHS